VTVNLKCVSCVLVLVEQSLVVMLEVVLIVFVGAPKGKMRDEQDRLPE
jgi:hypothetical protein